jgi:hypothetical protein
VIVCGLIAMGKPQWENVPSLSTWLVVFIYDPKTCLTAEDQDLSGIISHEKSTLSRSPEFLETRLRPFGKNWTGKIYVLMHSV